MAFWLIVAEREQLGAVLLWVVITWTDSLDGYLARRQGTTRSGAFLDPLADKVLALGGLWAMVIEGRFWWLPVAAHHPARGRHLGVPLLLGPPRARRPGLEHREGQDVPAVRRGRLGGAGPGPTDISWLADVFLWGGVAVAWLSGVQYLSAGSRATSTMDPDG